MHSSIFNFEQLRRYAALPVTERRWHATIAIVLAAVTLVCLRILPMLFGRTGCPGATLGSAAVASLSAQTDVLFAGSSHVLFGIRPQRYSVTVMNLAATWMDYTCIHRVVEKHLPRVPNLKVAVIEYDELPLVADLVPSMLATNDLRPLMDLGLTPLEIPVSDFVQQLRVIASAWTSPLTTLPRLTPLGWANSAQACPALYHPPQGFTAGYFYTDAVTPASYDPGVVFTSLESAAQNDVVVRRNVSELEETIALLHRRGVAVVLLRLPHSRDYAPQRPPLVAARWRQFQEHVRTLNVLALDWGENAAFLPGDFRDNHHLNAFGADKLARLLDPELRRLCRGAGH